MGNVKNFETVIFLMRVAPVIAPVFASLPKSDVGTEEKASHFAMVVALVCGQSRHFRVCRHDTPRVHNRARVGVARVGWCDSRWCVLLI